MKKSKILTTAVALGTAAALALGGTFAWQSINQTALNEASDIVNPGGRLHNDLWFETDRDTNSDIYVENFADDPIVARVRLEEYFEIVLNKGTSGEKTVPILGSKELKEGATVDPEGNPSGKNLYDYTYAPYDFSKHEIKDDTGTVTGFSAAVSEQDGTFMSWQTGGSTIYMPTFNKNKDSLAADLNGQYVDAVGGISNRAEGQYEAYTKWQADETKEAKAIYDIDSNRADELGTLSWKELNAIIGGTAELNEEQAKAVKLVNETHMASATAEAQLISMTEWLTMVEAAENGYDAATHGSYWVYDEDGWVYWSAPIAAHSATGLLLDKFTLNQVMDDTWYYAINVIGQFATLDDLGKSSGTGFYSIEDEKPTENAEKLLQAIGVELADEGGDDPDDEELTVASYHLEIVTDSEHYKPQYEGNYFMPGDTLTLNKVATMSDWTTEKVVEESVKVTTDDTESVTIAEDGTVTINDGAKMCEVYLDGVWSETELADTENECYGVTIYIGSKNSKTLSLKLANAGGGDDGEERYYSPEETALYIPLTYDIYADLSDGVGTFDHLCSGNAYTLTYSLTNNETGEDIEVDDESFEMTADNAGTYTLTATVDLFEGATVTYKNVVFATRTGGGEDTTTYSETFSENSWEQIAKAVQDNDAILGSWSVGDTKPMAFKTDEGDKEISIAIVGKNHDTYSEGGGTAPLTFATTQILQKAPMNNTSHIAGGWPLSQMRTSTIPTILSQMPSEVQIAIKAIDKQTGKNHESTELETTSDKLFLFSENEVFGINEQSAGNEGTHYSDYFTNDAIRTLQFDSSDTGWWLRSPYDSISGAFCSVKSDGTDSATQAGYDRGAVFGFCF